jgi:importin-5
MQEADAGEIDSIGRVQSHPSDDLDIQSMTVAVPGRGLSKVTVNTTKIQEKVQAIRALYEHVVALENAFEPYIVECFNVMLPLVSFKFSSDVRVAAAQTVAAASSVSLQLTENNTISTKYLPVAAQLISKQLTEEGDTMDVIFPLIESLYDILRSFYNADVQLRDYLLQTFDIEQVRFIVSVCMNLLKECLQRRNGIANVLVGEELSLLGDDEVEDYETRLQKEQEILTPLVDSVGYMLKMTKQRFIPLFEHLVEPVLASYLQMSVDTRARVSAVCLFDDVVEHCSPEGAAKYSAYLLAGAMLGINDATNGQDIDLKSASIYGIAQIARKAPPSVLAPHANNIIQQLAAIANSRKDEVDNLVIYENAMSCLGSLILFSPAPVDVSDREKQEFLKLFLDALPLSQDPDEAQICHAGFCDLIENQVIDIMSHCEIVVRIIGEIFAMVDDDDDDIVSKQTYSRLEDILIRVKDADQSGRIQNSFASLSVKGRAAVDTVLQNHWNQYSSMVST